MEFSSFDDMKAIVDTSRLSTEQVTLMQISVSMTGENLLDGKRINTVQQSTQIVPTRLNITQ
jgi:hypothetical protein